MNNLTQKMSVKLYRWLAAFALVATFSFNSNAQNATVTGANALSNGTYLTLGAAFTAINGQVQTGNNIVIDIDGNTTELATATLNAGAWATLTIKPNGGAARSITGALAAPLIDLNGADNVNINGLNTGGNSLTISNTSTSALTFTSTIRFNNDASSNTVQNCSLQGSSTAITLGTIYFYFGITTGNDNNTITNNTFDGIGGNLPATHIYSNGSTTAGLENSGNIVSNNNIANFFSASVISYGVFLLQGSTAWTISSNKFYQTALRTYTTANTHRAILCNTGGGHTISSNIIGYATSGGTGTYTMTGTIATRFIGIDITTTTGTATTSVQGNTITAISLGTSSGAATLNGIICGINITGTGNVNVGNTSANIIGATTGVDAIVGTPTTSGGAVVGINISSTGTILIQGNNIGALTSTGSTAAVAGAISGINISGAATSVSVNNNIIGNSTADNMRGGTLATTTGSTCNVIGINNTSTTIVAFNVTGNTIQNLSAFTSGTSGFVRGIVSGAGSGTTTAGSISGNTITNLRTNSALTLYTSGATTIAGILLGTGNGMTVSGNTISNLSGLSTLTTNIVVSGINIAGVQNATVSGNRIYGLSNAGTGTTATAGPVITGIMIRSAAAGFPVTVNNNMISLGNGQTTNTSIVGIMSNHGSTPDPSSDRIYFNTVNIEGAVTSGALPTACYNRGDLTATSRIVPTDVRNNIFTNTRSGGTGIHYAIGNNINSTSSATGWGVNASDYNVLNANAANVGFWTTSQTFASWKTASSSDVNSYSALSVNYVNSANDLHLNMGVTPTSLESGAVVIAGFATDYDGQTRPGPAGSVNGGAFAPDLGADEFDGVPATNCVGAPALAATQTSNANPCNGESFNLSLSIIYGVGHTYQWQEATAGAGGPYTNIGGATLATYTTSTSQTRWYRNGVTCTGSGQTTNSTEVQVTIAPALNGSYVIDNTGGGDYLTFAAAIADLSCLGVSGPVTFDVVDGQVFPEASNLECTFTGTSTNTITFQKQGAGVNPKIQRIGTSGTTDYILKLTGVDYYTFNGIDFEQTGTSATDWVEYGVWVTNVSATNGSQNNTIKNGVITLSNANANARGVNMNQAVTATSAAGANSTNKFLNMNVTTSYVGYNITGAATILDDNNEINTESGGTSIIQNLGNGTITGSLYGVFSTYQTNFKVKNTEFTNFNQGGTSLMYGVTCQTSATNSADISDNHMHGFVGAGTQYGIYFSSMDAATVANNHIHDFVNNTALAVSVRGIICTAAGHDINVYNNRIYDLTSNGLTTTTVSGIEIGTGTTSYLYNNMISDLQASSSTNTSGGVKAINISGGTVGQVIRIYYNSVYLNDVGAVAGYTAAGIYTGSVNPSIDIRNNVIDNSCDITVGTRVAAIWRSAATDNIDNNSNNNLYYAGAPDATHLIHYDGTNSNQTISSYNSLAAIAPGESASQTEDFTWQAIVNGVLRPDASIATYAESGGQNIAGYTTDFEANSRTGYPLGGQAGGGGFTPDMGADEGDFTFLVPPPPDCATYDAPANGAIDVCSYGTVTLDWTAAITGGTVSLGYDVYFGTNPTPPFVTNVTPSNYSPTGILPNTTYYWKIVPKNATGDAVGCATYSFTTINAEVTSATGDTRCGPGTVNLTASGAGTFNWYTAASGGSPVATGSPYSPSVVATTPYWVSASDGGTNGNVGQLSPTSSGGVISSSALTNHFAIFSVLAPSATINTVTIYPTATIGSSYNIIIQNSGLTQIFATGNFTNTVTGGATPQVVTLNAVLPAGTGYRIGVLTNAGMNRNTSGAVYPYTLPGVLSITGNTFDVNYYYYFYNWSVSTGCESPRTMVTATVNPLPTISLVSSTNASCFGVADGAIDVTVGAGTAPYTTSTMGASFSAIVVAKNQSHPYFGSGSGSGFEIDGVQGKELTLVRGVTYTFNINSPGHPMYISTDQDGAGVGEVLAGVTGSQTDFGTLTFTPNAGHPNLLYYQCFNHLNMGWEINIVDPPLNYDLASLHAGNYDITVSDANSCSATLATVTITEPAPNTFYYDGDLDTYGDENNVAIGCTAPGGYVGNSTDCNDGDNTINPGAAEICGNATDENCDGLAETVAPSQPSVIGGAPADVCPPATGINLSVTNDANATSYLWYTGPGTTGVTFNPVSTTNAQTIDIGASANSTYGIRVTASNACGTSPFRSISIRRATSTPAAVTGPTTVCALGTYGYSTGAVTGATSYLWSGPAGTTFDGANPTPYTTASNSVTATLPLGFTTGTIGVAAQVACFTSTVKTLAISATAPVIGIMTGATVVCPNTAYVYSVPANAGVATYNWTLPVGASGVSTTNSITVTYGATVTSSNICVTGTSACGSTTAARCITTGPGVPARPASITGPANGLCGQTVSYTCPVVAGATSYTWTSSAGGTINSGQGTNGINITFPTFTNTPAKTVCVVSNNACGTSVPRCITINGAPNTAAGITALPTSWCANATGIVFTANLTGVTGSYTLNWTYPGASVATYVSGGGNNTTLTLDWITGSGPVAVTTSNACGNGTRTVSFASTCREGEEVISAVDALNVYPNPTTGNINIEFSTIAKGNATVIVMDIAGRTVVSQNITTVEGANNTQLDLSTVAKGVYMLNVNTAEGNKKIKIVVE